MQATNAVYQFWWSELCDVYLEVCKPVIDSDNLEAKKISQNVLYTCLDQGLKLLHPFMPFVTEELYQRLPRRQNDTIPSIMITLFPEPVLEWQNEKAEKDFEFVNLVIHASRSLVSEYNIKGATIYVQSPNYDLLTSQSKIIVSLIRGCTEFKVLANDANPPVGCTLYTLDDTKIFLLVKGLVDLKKELEKLEKKRDKIQDLNEAILKKQSVDGYAVNCTEEIKELDTGKVKGYEAELASLGLTIENFSNLLIE